MSYIQKMLTWWKSLYGRSFRLPVLLLALMSMLTLTGCGGSPLSFLTGGGPNVAANVQAGKQNNQTIGTSTVREFGDQTVRAERVNSTQSQENKVNANDVQTVVVNEIPAWVVLLLIAGWLLPSPGEISRTVHGWFSRKKKGE